MLLNDVVPCCSSSLSSHETRFSCLKTISLSLQILLQNKKLFFSIFTLTILPLSVLVFTSSFISLPTRTHIFRLENHVARFAATRIEARHVWQESRSDAVSALRLKGLFFVPCYILSLFAAVASVTSTSSAYNNNNPTLRSSLNAVRVALKQTLLTSMYCYVIMLLYVNIPLFLSMLTWSPVLRILVLVIGSGLEVYLMAVLSMGMVVSILEENKFGFGAIRVGSGLMEGGKRVFGWGVSCGLVGLTGWIGWSMERVMVSKRPWRGWAVMAVMSEWKSVGLVWLYGLVILWGFVVMTVFYCECRRVHVSKSSTEMVAV